MSLESFGILAGLLCLSCPIYLAGVFLYDCFKVTQEYRDEHNLNLDTHEKH